MQGIVVYLVKMLDRSNIELLILCTAFLKKLSIYQENKDQMAACGLVPRLVRLMAADNEVLLLATLRLLHNLSFDSGLQDEMVKQGLLPKVPLPWCLQCLQCTVYCVLDSMILMIQHLLADAQGAAVRWGGSWCRRDGGEGDVGSFHSALWGWWRGCGKQHC